MNDLPGYITVTEAQQRLKVTNRQVILNHLKRRGLGIKIGWNWLIPIDNLEKLRDAINNAK